MTRIMIVEDDAIVAAHLNRMLSQMNYDVVGLIATGEEAISRTAEIQPDVILMDIRLRGEMNGITAAENIRSRWDIPVVYLTAYADEPLLQQAKATEPYGYLAKPVREKELHASLEVALFKNKAELRLKHLNQVLRAVRDINQLIVYEQDPKSLIDKACSILVAARGYMSAWVGRKSEVDNKVHPLAGAGDLKSVDLLLDAWNKIPDADIRFRRGERYDQAQICPNIHEDEFFISYLSSKPESTMDELGFSSLIVVPLWFGGQSYGALTVENAQINGFDEEEISLLCQMGSDLAYGMKRLDEEDERRKMDADLRQSEEKYRRIFTTASEGIWLNDSQLTTTQVNKRIADMLGYSQEEITGKPIFDFYFPEDEEDYKQKISNRRAGISERYERRYRKKDGGTLWTIVSAMPLNKPGEDFTGSFAMITDITDRKLAEEALRKSENRYRQLFENSPIGLIEEDFSRTRVLISEVTNSGVDDLKSYFFHHPDELTRVINSITVLDINRTLLDMIHISSKKDFRFGSRGDIRHAGFDPSVFNFLIDEICTLASGRTIFEGELPMYTSLGEALPAIIRITIAPGYEETWGRVLVSAVDISAQKKAETLVRAQFETLHTLYEGARALTGTLDEQQLSEQTVQRCVDVFGVNLAWVGWAEPNGKLTVMSSYPPDYTFPKELSAHWQADSAEIKLGPSSKAVLSKRPVIQDIASLVDIDDQWIEAIRNAHLSAMAAIPLVSHEEPVGVLCLYSTIQGFFTVDKVDFFQAYASQVAAALENGRLYRQAQIYADELEWRVAQRTAQLEEANKELEAFSYSVSHDLRAPLRGIDGFSEILVSEFSGELGEKGEHYLERIRSATHRMDQLITDLLNLSRLNRRELIPRHVNLSALAVSISDDLRNRSPERALEITVQEGMEANGDEHLLKIALSNLLDNAVKFSSKRPVIRVEVGKVEEKNRTVYFIKDNGVGFNMDYANKLFGAFQRLHSERDYPGTGIGLVTVQRIIRRHNGHIWVDARTDEGATFFFTLNEAGVKNP